jgi:hypothetical protein
MINDSLLILVPSVLMVTFLTQSQSTRALPVTSP